MPLNLLFTWWNLIFVVPFGLALTYLGMFVFTGITFGDADADADVDLDADASVHIEAHVADADSGAEFDHDADAHTGPAEVGGAGIAILPHHGIEASLDADTGHHPILAFLTLLGVGKIPLSLALMIFLLSWGLVGFALNALLVQWLGATFTVGFISVPVTLVMSLTITGLCAALLARVIPSDESARQRRQDLVGKAGEAMFDIDASFGMATVRGDAGDFFQIPCRTAEGTPRIPKGSRVVVFDYDRERGFFHVAPFRA